MKIGECGLAYEATGPDDQDFGIVLIHGWGCRHSDFDGVRRELTNENDEYRIIAVDLPGHGETHLKILPQPSCSGFADLVLTLCRELGLKQIVVVGHSMGTRVVAEVTKDSLPPDSNPKVLGTVLIDGSHYKLRPSLFAFDNGDPRSANMSEETKAALKAQAFNNMFSPLTPQTFRDSTLAHIAAMDQTYSHAVRDAMIGYDRTDMEATIELLGKEGVTVLNLQSSDIGAENQRVPMREGERSKWMVFLEERVPQVRQRVVEGSAHFPHVDRPGVVAGAIGEFVREVR